MVKPVIEVGKNITAGKEFRAWLKANGYETDTGRTNKSCVDGDDIDENATAYNIWEELYSMFIKDQV